MEKEKGERGGRGGNGAGLPLLRSEIKEGEKEKVRYFNQNIKC